MIKQGYARLNVDLIVDERALEFVLGVLESAEIVDLPEEVATDVSFIINMVAEKVREARKS